VRIADCTFEVQSVRCWSKEHKGAFLKGKILPSRSGSVAIGQVDLPFWARQNGKGLVLPGRGAKIDLANVDLHNVISNRGNDTFFNLHLEITPCSGVRVRKGAEWLDFESGKYYEPVKKSADSDRAPLDVDDDSLPF